MLTKLDQRQEERKAESTTPLYQDIAVMKASRLSPAQWCRLSRLDKKILHYFRIIEVYYIEFSPERVKMRAQAKEAEKKRKQQEILGKMPGLSPRFKGRR